MAISLVCPFCERTIRVKDELAGRKIRCPDCKGVVAVPSGEANADEESPPRRAMHEDQDAAREQARQNADEAAPPKKKKKGILSMDVNQLNQSFNNFDVRRFTPVGWLLFVIALAAGIGCGIVADMNFERIMGPRRPNELVIKYYAPAAIGGAIGGLGTFFGAMGILHLFGIKAIRPRTPIYKPPVEDD